MGDQWVRDDASEALARPEPDAARVADAWRNGRARHVDCPHIHAPTTDGGVLKLIRGWGACSSHGPYAQVMRMCKPLSYWIRHCAGAVKRTPIWGCRTRSQHWINVPTAMLTLLANQPTRFGRAEAAIQNPEGGCSISSQGQRGPDLARLPTDPAVPTGYSLSRQSAAIARARDSYLIILDIKNARSPP